MEGVWGCAPTSKMSENLQCKFSANGVSGYPLALLAILPNAPIWKSVLIRIGGLFKTHLAVSGLIQPIGWKVAILNKSPCFSYGEYHMVV